MEKNPKYRTQMSRESYWRAKKLLQGHERGKWKAINFSASVGVPMFVNKKDFIILGELKFKKTTHTEGVRIGKVCSYNTEFIRQALRILGVRKVELGLYLKGEANFILGLWHKKNVVLIAPRTRADESEPEIFEIADRIPKDYSLLSLYLLFGERNKA